MFCPNCGNKIGEHEEFCSNCGYHLKVKETLSEHLARNNPIIPFFKKIRSFVLNNKKAFIVFSSGFILLIVGLICFYTFYDFTKLSWDEDSDVSISEPKTLTLGVISTDKEGNEITDIKFSVSSGKINSDGTSVEWSLPKKNGNYKIKATAPSGKTIEKTVKVVNLEDSNENPNNLNGVLEVTEEDENADNDSDGIINSEEDKLGTNKNNADTDMDGLNDYYEVNISKTDPLNKDSDNDGIRDGDELDLGLNPLLEDSFNDGIEDNKRTLTYNIDDSKLGVSLTITGKGNIASSTIDIFSNQSFQNIDGLLDKVYNFYTDGVIENATVKINYSLDDITTEGLNEDNLTLYYFNEDTKELEALPTTVDKVNKQLIVTLNHFSKYVIGDSDKVITDTSKEILFVIDNSVSMYSNSQMIEAGYSDSRGAVGNDKDFKRFTLTNKLIDMFTGNYKFGVSEFAGSYNKLSSFSDNHNKVKETVNSMKSNWQVNTTGTAIVTALDRGVKEFSDKENNNYLILLTDGKNTRGSLSSSKDDIISNAKENNIKICVIGLGDDIDADDLGEIAKSTGCDYYNASLPNALDEIYAKIGADINYNYVDTDNDNEVDGMINVGSGFLVNRDGFSFKNFRSNKSYNGHCYGMATFAMLYYENKLPLSLGAKDNSRFVLSQLGTMDLASEGYNLNNTYFDSNNNLYDFKITTEALTYLLGNTPNDYRDRVDNDNWMIKKGYYNKLSRIGAEFSIEDYEGEEEYAK